MNGEGIDIYGNRRERNGKALQPKSLSSIARKYYAGKMSAFTKLKITKSVGTMDITIGFNRYGNRHLYSDTFRRSKTFQKDDLLHLPELLDKSQYVQTSPLSKLRKDKISKFYYFKVRLHGNHVYLNVAEEKYSMKSGHIRYRRYLYSVTDKIKNQ